MNEHQGDEDDSTHYEERESFINLQNFVSTFSFDDSPYTENDYNESPFEIERLDPFTYLDLYDTLEWFSFDENDPSVKIIAFNIKGSIIFPGQYLPFEVIFRENVKIIEKYFLKNKMCLVFVEGQSSGNKIGSLCRLISHDLYSDLIEATLVVLCHKLVKVTEMQLVSSMDINTKIYMVSYKTDKIDASPFHGFVCSDPNTRQLYTLGHMKSSQHIIPFSNHFRLSLKQSIDIILEWFYDRFQLGPEYFPNDPYDFFIRIAAMVPCSFKQQFDILETNNLILRMKKLSECFERNNYIVCIKCNYFLASIKDISSKIFEITPFHYSPYQMVFDVIPFDNVSNYAVEDVWHSNLSFFDHYMWQIILCDGCYCHIGWRYKPLDSESELKKFHGVIRKSIKLITQLTSGVDLIFPGTYTHPPFDTPNISQEFPENNGFDISIDHSDAEFYYEDDLDYI